MQHHLIDILEPTQEFNVVLFQKLVNVESLLGGNLLALVLASPGFRKDIHL